MLRSSKDEIDRSRALDSNTSFPVRAPSTKAFEKSSNANVYVKCISSHPLVYETSREELRINSIHLAIQGRNLGTMPNNFIVKPLPNSTQSAPPQIVMPGQKFGSNPFIKRTEQMPQTMKMGPMGGQSVQLGPQSNNPFVRQNNNAQNFNSALGFGQTNKSQNPFNRMINNTSDSGPALTKQTSFDTGPFLANPSTQPATGSFGSNQPTGLFQNPHQSSATFLNQNSTASTFGNSFAGQTTFGTQPNQLPGKLTQSPSFGAFIQSTPQQSNNFVQPSNVINQTVPLTSSNFTSSVNPGGPSVNPGGPSVNAGEQGNLSGTGEKSSLEKNIEDLLSSRPNLWNILALDPGYRNGYNEAGRVYVKSVLQRIIDENILAEDSLNKVIVEIYKQLYGAQNFQKTLEQRKKQFSNYGQFANDLSSKARSQNTDSLFPKELRNSGDEFYRSFKRRSSKFYESKSRQKDDDGNEAQIQRRFFNLKRQPNKLQFKVKFIQMKETKQPKTNDSKQIYTKETLDKISQTIHETRVEHRKKIMPLPEELPNVEGFQIEPSIETLRKFTRYELLSVPKVKISNEWGSIRFKAPVSLLQKNLGECIVIAQKSIEIVDEEWKARDSEIIFKKFADFMSLDDYQQEELYNKIVRWCETQSYELLKIDKLTGSVTIEI